MVVLVVRKDVRARQGNTASRNTSSVMESLTARVEPTRILTTVVSLCMMIYFVIVKTQIWKESFVFLMYKTLQPFSVIIKNQLFLK